MERGRGTDCMATKTVRAINQRVSLGEQHDGSSWVMSETSHTTNPAKATTVTMEYDHASVEPNSQIERTTASTHNQRASALRTR